MQITPGAALDDATITRLAHTNQRAELHAIRTAPHTRIVVWIGLVIAAELSLIIAVITRTWTGFWIGLIPTIPTGIWLAVTATTRWGARNRYRKAWRVAWHGEPHHSAVACIRHHQDRYIVESVAAWPTGTGLGGQLMDYLTTHPDTAHLTLHLQASSPRVRRFYQRHGWQPTTTHRTWPGGYPMTHTPTCNAPTTTYSGLTEHTQSAPAGSPHPQTPQTPHQP